MRVFEEGDWDFKGRICPICKSGKKGKVVLIPIAGKQKGRNCRAVQVHLECLDLWFNGDATIIYQIVERKNGN